MQPFNLPDDAVQFLRGGSQLAYRPEDCEPGLVKLKSLSELILGEVWIDTDQEGDPNHGSDGYYAVPAVSLTGECEDYDPEFILLWLPNERMFGSWDSDHWVLTVFPEVEWSDIVANPPPYLDAQWNAGNDTGKYFAAWTGYEFKTGRPF